MQTKRVFTTSDATVTAAKIEILIKEQRKANNKLIADLERILVEVELLRDANHAMAKTIRESRYGTTNSCRHLSI